MCSNLRFGLCSLTCGSSLQAFQLFDTDGKETLDVEELKYAIYAMGFTEFENARETAEKYMQQIDKDGNKTIDLKEFKELMQGKLAGLDLAGQINRIYEYLCTPGTNYITFESLQCKVCQLCY